MPEERKLVTVLFADIVGSTTMAVEYDAEVIQTALGGVFDRVAPLVEAHGGTVEKFIGDAVMAVFGVPAAHDDDAERAVRTAFAIRDAVALLHRPIALEVRIGLASGEAVTRIEAGDQRLVTGLVVNLAQRLQAAAGAGEILVGDLAYDLTKDAVRYAEPRAIQAKGIGEVIAHSAQALVHDVPSQHQGPPGLWAPLIGREQELGLLRRAHERVAVERSVGMVTVVGPAGAGKSRLVTEFLDVTGRDRARVGRCLPYGEAIAFHPLRLILHADAGIDATDDKATARAKLRTAVRGAVGERETAAVLSRLEVIAALAPPSEALPSVAQEQLAEELQWGFRRYVEGLTASGPLALVLEDVHWAEPALLDLVDHLVSFARGPLLVILLARPEFSKLRQMGSLATAQVIALAPLTPDDTRRLVAELLPVNDLSEPVRAEVVARAGGNPLYVEEFLRTLIESGLIAERDGRWVATGEIIALEIPPTLVGLITTRLDRLSPHLKAVLLRASVLGPVFSLSALDSIGDRVANDFVVEAIARDLLVEADEYAPGEGRVHRFKHVLIRDVAYSMVAKADRAKMHDRYSRWLEASFGDRQQEFGEITAHHAEQAYLHAREVHAVDAHETGQRALDLLLPAADRAHERGDVHAALGLYERAATVADAIEAPAAMRVRARGWATLEASLLRNPDDERDHQIDALIVAAERLREHRLLFHLLGFHRRRAFRHGEDARPVVARMLGVARESGDPELLVAALINLGTTARLGGDPASSRAPLEDAVREARRSRSPRLRVALRFFSEYLARHEGRFTEASGCWREEADLVLPGVSTGRDGWRSWEIAFDSLLVGDFPAAATAADRTLTLAREAALPGLLLFALWVAGDVLLEPRTRLERADLEGARNHFEEGLTIAEHRDPLRVPELSARAARACVRLDDLAAASRHLDAAKRGHHFLETLRVIATAEAELAAASGDRETADRVMRDGLAKLDGVSFGWDVALLRISYGALLTDWARTDDARRELARAREFFGDPLAVGWRRQIDTILAHGVVVGG